jgi:hypothetical protein
MILRTRILLTALVAISGLTAIGQQQPTSPPANPSSPPASQSQPAQTQQQSQTTQQPTPTSAEVLRQEEKQRALGVMPMFGMTSIHNAPPLTTQQKLQLMTRTLIDPFTFFAAGLQAGIGQAQDSFAAYGQGSDGYAKRYGAAFADSADSNFFSNFVYPTLFKQDPRYFRLGEGPVKKRIFYAVESEFIARKDSGGHTFHFSNVLGAITAGTISNTYYPQADRGVGLTASRAAIALGWGTLGDELLEFWPDIDKKFFNHQRNQAKPTEPPGLPPK